MEGKGEKRGGEREGWGRRRRGSEEGEKGEVWGCGVLLEVEEGREEWREEERERGESRRSGRWI